MNKEKADEIVKSAAETVSIPESLEPDNIAQMLQEKSESERRRKLMGRIKKITAIGAAAAVLVVCVSVLPKLDGSSSLENHANEQSDSLLDENAVLSANTYEKIFAKISKPQEPKEKSFWEKLFSFGSSDEKNADHNISYVEAAPSADLNRTDGITNETSSKDDKSYSDTINQVEGIDEADIVKTDGENIFFLAKNILYRIEAKDGKFGAAKRLYSFEQPDVTSDNDGRTSYYEARDLYLCGDKIVVISYEVLADSTKQACVRVLSKTGELLSKYSQDGEYINVRMKNDTLYLVTNNFYFTETPDVDKYESYIPTYCENGETKFIEPNSICVPEQDFSLNYTVVGAFDVQSGKNVGSFAVAGTSSKIYMTDEHLYVASTQHNDTIFRKLSLSGSITLAATATQKGYVHDQFSMDEYNGMFRVALNYQLDQTYQSESGVYIFDSDMKLIGSVGGLGKDENIQSVSFSGDKAYVVTFRQTDPLYAIDLSNPTKPIVTSELKITGFSSYMYQWSDELLLGFGVEANDLGIRTGVKLAMFTKSADGNVTQSGYVSFTDEVSDSYITSPAVDERKALYIDSERNLIGIPVWTYETQDILTEYIIYSYDNGAFTELGRISARGDDGMLRMLRIGNYLYSLSNVQAVAYSIEKNGITDTLALQ